jgi:toxin YoeB
MSYDLKFTPTALKDIEDLKKSGDKLILKRLLLLFNELTEHPRIGIGHPEELKYHYAGYWSRRINQQHRLVYSINDETVTVIVIQAKGHYGS